MEHDLRSSSGIQRVLGQPVSLTLSGASSYSAMNNPVFRNVHSAYNVPLRSYHGMDATVGLPLVMMSSPFFASAPKERSSSGIWIYG
jgi:solute carrier family 25 (adenine nucleotide translocator) protein 4/5/6/31